MPASPARRRFLGFLFGSAAVGVSNLSAAGAAEPRLREVIIRRFAFNPPDLEIRAGDSVIWTNQDLAPHTASADDGAWDSGELARGVVHQVRFDSPGIYAYHCTFHPHMRGRITVTAG